MAGDGEHNVQQVVGARPGLLEDLVPLDEGDDVLDADDPMLSGLGGRASASLVSAESLEDLRRKFSEAEEKVGPEA